MTGLKVRAGGKLLEWTRDPVEVYAFHVDTPAGTKSVDVEFQFTSPVRESEGRIVVTPAMMNVQWEQVSLLSRRSFHARYRGEAFDHPSVRLDRRCGLGWRQDNGRPHRLCDDQL